MEFTLKNVNVYKNGHFSLEDYFLNQPADVFPVSIGGIVSDFNNCFVFPAFCDVHVHLREPGFSYKETITSGTKAAAHGGYTAVFSMPNLKPVPDSKENLKKQTDLINDGAVIKVYPYASITVGQMGEALSDFEGMYKDCAGFSDDGKGVQSQELMRQAMLKAKALGKIIVAHCEDNSLLNGGYIHDGEYAKLHGHKGICSESEWKPIERDLKLAKETGCKYHVCHISCKESVELIRKAKAEGVDVTCETAPHYLVMNDMMLQEDGRFKMNPPIRSESDRLALVEGLKDGTIDMIATDHAPHSQEEKSKGLEKSFMGVVGLETAFSVLYTKLVKTGVITLEKLIEVMSINPRKRFGLADTEDICIFDLNGEYTVDPEKFLSKGRATPFKGEILSGVCRLTVCDNKIVYKKI
ncbi:MAG: dihydroorotase [Clostridia bacterium]|nr:dihydroorotase [Clostridia bacterium]